MPIPVNWFSMAITSGASDVGVSVVPTRAPLGRHKAKFVVKVICFVLFSFSRTEVHS